MGQGSARPPPRCGPRPLRAGAPPPNRPERERHRARRVLCRCAADERGQGEKTAQASWHRDVRLSQPVANFALKWRAPGSCSPRSRARRGRPGSDAPGGRPERRRGSRGRHRAQRHQALPSTRSARSRWTMQRSTAPAASGRRRMRSRAIRSSPISIMSRRRAPARSDRGRPCSECCRRHRAGAQGESHLRPPRPWSQVADTCSSSVHSPPAAVDPRP